MAILNLANISRSYGGVSRPVHVVLKQTISRLEEYRRCRDSMLLIASLSSSDMPSVKKEFDEILDCNDTLPELTECVKYYRARLMLRIADERNAYSAEPGIKVPSYFPNEQTAEAWRQLAIIDLGALSRSTSGHRMMRSASLSELGIVRTEDPAQTARSPTFAELAEGALFRDQHLKPGRLGPDLSVELLSGDTWNLRQDDSSLTIIQFSFTGCAPCEKMYPVLKRLSAKHSERLTVLTVMTDENRELSERSIKSGKISWLCCWDGRPGEIATRWGVNRFPSTYIFDDDHRVVSSNIPAEYLEQVIEAQLNGE
ncbi:MAG TPA: hypothetical protein DDW52_07720 [Planctomycetaceae bacterium]|nr:hypothetical protein [Planctomycetaceae bacterium]